ncbi:hypothetical protein K8O68_13610 [Salipaludibacillus sp. CUR1]|uniref:hypothetical protein n=1 Tax=Salipaludibacillus sp. CUR1 TaxID=2820003 RepID=UPI001E57C3A2|nr:hypothetical protein [Salipaludibacillus sp. CUR1]MCE7793457.1 hypothetical protein [Salipaludibacillus sp. CUR1]
MLEDLSWLSDYYTFLSGFAGILTGGLITWLVTRDSLHKQFQEQDKRQQAQERRNEIIALNAVHKEIQHNLIQFRGTKNIMEGEKMELISYKASNLHNNYSMEKWNQHSDTVLFIEDLDCLSKLQAFYINLSFEITNQVTNKKKTEKLIESGLHLSKQLEQYIEAYKKQETA